MLGNLDTTPHRRSCDLHADNLVPDFVYWRERVKGKRLFRWQQSNGFTNTNPTPNTNSNHNGITLILTLTLI